MKIQLYYIERIITFFIAIFYVRLLNIMIVLLYYIELNVA